MILIYDSSVFYQIAWLTSVSNFEVFSSKVSLRSLLQGFVGLDL